MSKSRSGRRSFHPANSPPEGEEEFPPRKQPGFF